jgi:hypothetical protein
MDSLKSFLQFAASLENKLNGSISNDIDISNIFEDYLNAGIDQLEIACQMQITRNDRDILTITVIDNLLKYPKQPVGFTDKVLDNLMVGSLINLIT